MERLPFTDAEHVLPAIERCERVLAARGVVMIPTETFYGLAVRPDDRRALDRVMAMKDRPAKMPLPVLVADWQQLESLVQVPETYRAKLSRLWPAALTVVLPLRQPIAAASQTTLAIRIPQHDLLRALLYRVGPLTGTSANRHQEIPPTDPDRGLETLAGEPDLLLDGGVTDGGKASTLVDLSGEEIRILRQGSVLWDDALPTLIS